MTERIAGGSCEGCEHLLMMTGMPHADYPKSEYCLCGFDPFDTNLPGQLIGFAPKTPDWCPLVLFRFSESFLKSVEEAVVYESSSSPQMTVFT